jgi:hypothetical protein
MKRLLIAFIWLVGLAMVPAAQTLNPACPSCPTLEGDDPVLRDNAGGHQPRYGPKPKSE